MHTDTHTHTQTHAHTPTRAQTHLRIMQMQQRHWQESACKHSVIQCMKSYFWLSQRELHDSYHQERCNGRAQASTAPRAVQAFLQT